MGRPAQGSFIAKHTRTQYKITDNVIYNSHVSTDTPLADGIIGAFTAVGTASEFTLTVTGNTVYSSSLNTALTLGKATDTYHKFTMIYKDNNIMLNKGTSAVPVWSSILSSAIQTNGAFYTNFLGDLDTTAKLVLQPAEYTGSDVGTAKPLSFDATKSVGFVPQSDGSLMTSELNAYYRAEVDLSCVATAASATNTSYVRVRFAGETLSAFLNRAPDNYIRATLYIGPSNLTSNNGIMQMTVESSVAINGINGSVKLFRLA